MLERFSANNPGLHLALDTSDWLTFLVCRVTISVDICMSPCFTLFLSDLNSFSHSAFSLWLFFVPQIFLQNLLLSSVSGFSLLSVFPFSCWYTLFWSCWNNLFILYCSILWSYLLFWWPQPASFVLALLELHLNLFSWLYICVLLLCISLYFQFLRVSFTLRC